MSETVLRRSYRHNIVLIESDRVLTPQFDDAVIYVTGAQVELLRNVTQYLRRRETYADDIHLGYYVMPDDSDYDEILEIVADLEETLMGNPNTIWGYGERWQDRGRNQDTPAGEYTHNLDTVPAGKVYVVNLVQAVDLDSAITRMEIKLEVGSSTMVVKELDAPGIGVPLTWEGSVILAEGDRFRATYYGVVESDETLLHGIGYEMNVPE